MAFEGSELPEPYEFLDLEHGASVHLTITRYELGTALIHPTVVSKRQLRIYMLQNGLTEPPSAGTPISIRIPVLRVWGTEPGETAAPPYWDISSKRLIADLQPRLNQNGPAGLTVTLTANGYKPTKRYSVEVG